MTARGALLRVAVRWRALGAEGALGALLRLAVRQAAAGRGGVAGVRPWVRVAVRRSAAEWVPGAAGRATALREAARQWATAPWATASWAEARLPVARAGEWLAVRHGG
ncbi:hypothetical protein ACWERV_18825 [Streptomyces sp. NPDC004031]